MTYKKGFIIFSVFYIAGFSALAYPQEENGNSFSSRFCTVFYENDVNLKKVNIRMNPGFSNFYSPRNYKENPCILTEDIISNKLDAIFNRAEEILDMYPAEIHVSINVYKTQEGLNKAYEEFFNEPNKEISFYIYKTNTIYTAESQLNENMLAHEMAHCIIDHYFIIMPPRKIQEMLAVYVDMHLKD
jgi:hypothetical protein